MDEYSGDWPEAAMPSSEPAAPFEIKNPLLAERIVDRLSQASDVSLCRTPTK